MNPLTRMIIESTADTIISRAKEREAPSQSQDQSLTKIVEGLVKFNEQKQMPILTAFHMYRQIDSSKSEEVRSLLHDNLDVILDLLDRHAKEIAKSIK